MKSLLDIDPRDNTEDKKLGFYNEMAGNLIEELLNRDFTYKLRTEYYNGTNTQKLLLKARPVYTTPTMQVWQDGQGAWGQSSDSFPDNSMLTYGTDYALQIDQDNGSSRCGILQRLRGWVWNQPFYRSAGLLTPYLGSSQGSIKIIYQAGYSVDTLPAAFRLAADILVDKIRYLFPLGQPLSSESYEERSISLIAERKDWMLADIKPLIMSYRNYKF